MVGKPGARSPTKRRGQTRLLAGLSAVAAGVLLLYFGRESSAGGHRQQQQQQQPLLPLGNGLRGAAISAVTSELSGTIDPATFASTSGEGERRLVAGGDVVLPVAVLAEAQAAAGSAGLLMNTDDLLPKASSAASGGASPGAAAAAADAVSAAATSAAEGSDATHKFLDGVMKDGGGAVDAAAAAAAAATAGTAARASSTSAKVAGTTAATALVDKAEAVAGSAAPEAKPLGLYFKEDVKEAAKKRGATVAHRQAIARLRAAGAAGDGGAANETKPLGFYFGLNANEKDQAGLTVGGRDDSQGVAAGIAQKAVAAQQLAEEGGDVRLFSLARRLLWRPFELPRLIAAPQ